MQGLCFGCHRAVTTAVKRCWLTRNLHICNSRLSKGHSCMLNTYGGGRGEVGSRERERERWEDLHGSGVTMGGELLQIFSLPGGCEAPRPRGLRPAGPGPPGQVRASRAGSNGQVQQPCRANSSQVQRDISPPPVPPQAGPGQPAAKQVGGWSRPGRVSRPGTQAWHLFGWGGGRRRGQVT